LTWRVDACANFYFLLPSPLREHRLAVQTVRAFAALGCRTEDIMDYDRPVSPDESRRIARTFGVLYLITFATSIPALWLYQPVLDNPAGYVAGAGHNNKILLGAFLELLLIIANIGTATVVYPLLKRENEICAISYVTARLVECTFILVGILTMLAVVTLQRNPSAGTAATLGAIAYTLAAIKDWTFLLGPGFVVGIGNGLLLGYLMYRSELVPKRMAVLGLIAGPLLIISGIAVMFGVAKQGGPLQGIATVPEFIWELFLGIYPLVWGFNAAAPILSGSSGRRSQGTPTVAPS
jgi:hypothetical protein